MTQRTINLDTQISHNRLCTAWILPKCEPELSRPTWHEFRVRPNPNCPTSVHSGNSEERSEWPTAPEHSQSLKLLTVELSSSTVELLRFSTVLSSYCRTVELSCYCRTVETVVLSSCRATVVLSSCRTVELSYFSTVRQLDSNFTVELSNCRDLDGGISTLCCDVGGWLGGGGYGVRGGGRARGWGDVALEVPSGSSLAAAPRIPRPTQATDGTAHSCSGGMERNEKAPSPPLAPRLRGEQKHESMWPWPRACGVDKNESLWLWPRACGTRHHRGLPAGVDSGHGALFVRGHAVHVVEHCIHAAVEERVVE
eukprot:gene7328-biopygen12042